MDVGGGGGAGGRDSPDTLLSVDLTRSAASAASSSLSSWVMDASPSSASSPSPSASSASQSLSSTSYPCAPPSQCEARVSDEDGERSSPGTAGSGGSSSGGGSGNGDGSEGVSGDGGGSRDGGGVGGGGGREGGSGEGGGATERVLEAVLREFDLAERAVSEARKALMDRGFCQPSLSHILQFIRNAREGGGAEGGTGAGEIETRVAMRGSRSAGGGGGGAGGCCVFLASAALSVGGVIREQHEKNVLENVSGTASGHVLGGVLGNVPRNVVGNKKAEDGDVCSRGDRGSGGNTAATAAGSMDKSAATVSLAVSDTDGGVQGEGEDDEDEDEDGWFGAMDGDKEAVGSWGFRDSGFSLESDRADGGNPYVVMRGNRWVEGERWRGRGGGTLFLHGHNSQDHKHSLPYDAGTEHVGFSRTRQTDETGVQLHTSCCYILECFNFGSGGRRSAKHAARCS